MRVLILGGYGTFGFNIVRLLKDEAKLTFILAGRNLDKAQAACVKLTKIGGKGTYQPLRLDRSQNLTTQIQTPPDIIIDATGPFQKFHGEDAVRVIKYAIMVGANYIDLSDDTRFIKHIISFDAEAKAAKITALSGLSTYPALTGAVLDYAREIIPQPTSLGVGIAPSPHAELGKNVLAAILDSAGRKQIYMRENGETQYAYGLIKSHWRVIAPPLKRPLKSLLCLQIDSPAALFTADNSPLNAIHNYVSPQPIWMLRLLHIFSYLARLKLFPPLRLFTSLFHRLHRFFSRGEHRSGFYAVLKDERRQIDFYLTAEGDDGPLIPSIPAAVLIMQRLHGEALMHGARHSLGAMSWAQYAQFFDRLDIEYGHYETQQNHKKQSVEVHPVYRQLLNESFMALPTEIQKLHDIDREKTYEGRADIIRGKNPLSMLISALFRFPKAGKDIAVTIRRVPLRNNLELWERNFNGRKMRSTQAVGSGRRAHMIIERFGPIALSLAYYKEETPEKYRVEVKGWRLFGLPMPAWLSPHGDVYEFTKDGKFHFHVDLKLPVIGRLVKYVGWFNPSAKVKATD